MDGFGGNLFFADSAALGSSSSDLAEFMARAGPVMEQLVEENTKLRFAQFQDGAGKPAAIELKQTLQFPEEILIMLGQGEERAVLENITAIHMFETAP